MTSVREPLEHLDSRFRTLPGARVVDIPNAGMPATKLLALTDVTDTAWHGCELADVQKGAVVGVWGCGAIGLSIMRLSLLRRAKKACSIDKDPYRLALAEKYGATLIDVSKHRNVADYVLQIESMGLDRGVEASGFRSTNTAIDTAMRALMREGDTGDTVSEIIKATRKAGNITLIGDFFFGTNQFPIGALMEKTISLRGRQLMAQTVWTCSLWLIFLPLLYVDKADSFL